MPLIQANYAEIIPVMGIVSSNRYRKTQKGCQFIKGHFSYTQLVIIFLCMGDRMINHEELVKEITQELYRDNNVRSVSRNEKSANSDIDLLAIINESTFKKDTQYDTALL